MNLFLFFERKLMYWMQKIRSSGRTGRIFSHHLLLPVYQWLRKTGRRRYLYKPTAKNAGWDIRDHLFRRFRIYVECHLANISHRYVDAAPQPMPARLETRQKWGLKALEHFAEEGNGYPQNTEFQKGKIKEGYAELARIYRWIINDRKNWETPLSNVSESFKPCHLNFSEEGDRFFTDRAERIDSIYRTRVEGRAKRLFERKHLLKYDC